MHYSENKINTVSGGDKWPGDEYGPRKICDIFANQKKVRLSFLDPFSPLDLLFSPLTVMISSKNRGKLCMTVLKFRSKKLHYNSYGLLLHNKAS